MKTGETPVKCVKGMFNDPQRVAELYGFWQTQPFKLELTSDGHIPKNKYGNLELFNGPLPDECRWLDLPKIIPACKKLQVEFVPAVVGFDKGGPSGFSHPTIKGVVVFRADVKKIKAECEAQMSRIIEKKN